MEYKIGIFSKYRRPKNTFERRHSSACKIYKIIDELQNFIEFEYKVKYKAVDKNKYDFVICDRFEPKGKINSKYILNFSEGYMDAPWATHFCTTTLGVKIKKKNQFYLLNYCNGRKMLAKELSQRRSGAVFLGRVTGELERKIQILSKYIDIDVFPMKYWLSNGKILRFHNNNKESKDNIKFLQKRISRTNIKAPIGHDNLYKALNKNGYKIGFVPSVYSFRRKKNQKSSSSKFFEYIGCGIPVLIEASVPEAILVKRNPFLGEIYSNKEDMVRRVKKMKNKKFDYIKILKYANKNHFPDSRAKALYDNFIKHGI